MKKHTEHVFVVVITLTVLAIGLGAFAYSGFYDIGADNHHWPLTYQVMQTVRDRSIHMRSQHIKVPNLDDPQLILKGAGQYAAMCTGCHLAPGTDQSELRAGMYPQPPKLSRIHVAPQDAFWVIKHGIKMSAMPAWGGTHDDPTIWSMVAFLEKLPGMTPAEYKEIVAKAPPDEDMDMSMSMSMGGQQDHRSEMNPAAGKAPPCDMPAMPGMKPEATAPSKPPRRP